MRSNVASVTSLKTGAARLLRALNQNRRPVVITQSGQPRGVLLDFESYEELRDATLLLKLLAQGEADIRAGRTVPQNRVFSTGRGPNFAEDNRPRSAPSDLEPWALDLRP